jgi:hypothetical protein
MNEDDMNHITAFDDRDLPEGHLNRFMKKLDSSLHKSRKVLRFQLYAIAASIIAIIGLTVVLFIKMNRFYENPPLLAGISDELEETELFYQNQIQASMKELKKNNSIDKEVISDFKKMDKSFRLIRKDLKENPGDERIVNSVIKIYQIKLELLNNLVQEFK